MLNRLNSLIHLVAHVFSFWWNMPFLWSSCWLGIVLCYQPPISWKPCFWTKKLWLQKQQRLVSLLPSSPNKAEMIPPFWNLKRWSFLRTGWVTVRFQVFTKFISLPNKTFENITAGRKNIIQLEIRISGIWAQTSITWELHLFMNQHLQPKKIQPWNLTVRPWKQAIPKRKGSSSNHLFFRGEPFFGVSIWTDRVKGMKILVAAIVSRWFFPSLACITALRRPNAVPLFTAVRCERDWLPLVGYSRSKKV